MSILMHLPDIVGVGDGTNGRIVLVTRRHWWMRFIKGDIRVVSQPRP